MKYEGPKSYQSKDMANVKSLLQTNKGTNTQTDKRAGQKLYAPDG